jgi:hypothetical protein
MDSRDHIDVGERRVCPHCIREDFVSEWIGREGADGACFYCSYRGATITIETLGKQVAQVIDVYYEQTPDEPSGIERFAGPWWRDGEPIGTLIAELLKASEAIGEDVREVLDGATSDWDGVAIGEEQAFSEEAHYRELETPAISPVSHGYRHFENSVIEQARYFSPENREFLASQFGDLEGLLTRRGEPVIVEAGPGLRLQGFYRARVFQDDDRLKAALAAPDRDLGPPPPRSGTAGRLNAAGVSLFYGADAAETALAEVRPPVGSRVLIARFDLVRPVRLLDIDALQSLLVSGSLFDPEHVERVRRAEFLRSFSARFSRPVMPAHEAFEYIPTQAVADYVANEVKPRLDGILYASPQSSRKGKNVVLFHRASVIEPRAASDGVVSDVHLGYMTEEGYEYDYSVTESEVDLAVTSASESDQATARTVVRAMANGDEADKNLREATLRIDMASLEVRHISAVKVESQAFGVFRYRTGRNDGAF